MLIAMCYSRNILLVTMISIAMKAWSAPPLADVHVHYKWSQKEVTSPRQAIDTLEGQGIELAVVIGTPADYALELKQQAPQRIIAIWSPYRVPGDWSSWAFDRDVLERARLAMETRQFEGIGELHLIGGFSPHWQSPVIGGLAKIAAEYDVPLLLHTEISQPDYMKGLCRAYPDTRFLWAHAGAILTPDQVSVILESCSNVWIELSARDPWRFINNPITDQHRTLLPPWRKLIEKFSRRFMIGSDPVWPVEKLDGWEEPDTGWQQYSRFIGFHRDWLNKLSPELEQKLRLDNALEFFGKSPD